MRSGLAALLPLLCVLAACSADGPRAGTAVPSDASTPAASIASFTDRAAEAGLDFVHFSGMSGEYYFPEIMAPGLALLDFDGDDDLDVFFVQGQMLGRGRTLDDALIPPQGPLPPRGRLYRNDLRVNADGVRELRFTDVTDASGIDARGYGMGAAAADMDNDGCVDLYVTNLGRNQMFRNRCDGTFADVSRASRTDDEGWSVSASFFDYDRDGWLDLYVANYVEYSVAGDRTCTALTGRREYCPPAVYRAQPDRLFRNRGDGTFADVTATALAGGVVGPGLGVVAADFDADGWIDIYVANDGTENDLWMNQRDGTFRNTALLAGAAVNAAGQPQGSMGVDAGDLDNDGDEDLFMTHLPDEGTTVYLNDGSATFEDHSARTAVGPLTLGSTGFGAVWVDADNDGWLDILQANGRIEAIDGRDDRFPYDEAPALLRNLGTGRFEDVTARAGTAFQATSVGRGVAAGDLDNDGDPDVVITSTSGPARLLVNEGDSDHHWIGLRLRGGAAMPRDMLGARAIVVLRDGSRRLRRARADGSYASANDPRVLVGLGQSADPVAVTVEWPGGRVERWDDVAVDRWITLQEGRGASVPGALYTTRARE